MRIISKLRLDEAIERFPNLKGSLENWYSIAKQAQWKNLIETRRSFNHADQVRVAEDKLATVFNLSDGFRLIVCIHYNKRCIYIRHILSHADYDRGKWKAKL